MTFLTFVLFYAVIVGFMFQIVPYNKRGYAQTEERLAKSILWPFTLPFFIGSALANKVFKKQTKE